MKKRKFLYQATPDELFDPSNAKHRRAYRDFFVNGGWGDSCPFLLQPPFQSVPNMCRERLLEWYLSTDKKLASNAGR